MPRQGPRLDAPDTLNHIMGRGIDRIKIFQNNTDRNYFLSRVADFRQSGHLIIYDWVLMGNHLHLLVRPATNLSPLT